jgi:tape measure domain-containing protein
MLARLVVHLQANYGSLTSGLQVAKNQTAVAAQSISSSVAGISEGTKGIEDLSNRAEQLASAMEAVVTTATVAEQTIMATAFTADLAAGTFAKMAATASTVSAGVAVLDRATMTATGGIATVTSVAGSAVPVLNTLSGTAASAGTVLRTTAMGARSVASGFALAAGATRGVATGVGHVAHSIHAVMIVSSLLSSALSVIMIPLKAIAVIGAYAFGVLTFALRTVLLPVKLLWNGLTVVAGATWAVVKPIAGLALSVAKVWFIFKGWIGSIKLIWQWLSFLPPKVRLLVGALLALGLAGKAGAVAMRAFGFAVGAVATVARGAIAGVRLLSLPILALINPAAAAAVAINLLSGAAAFLGRTAASAGLAVFGLATRLGGLAAAGLSKVASSFAGLTTSLMRFGAQAAIIGTIAASIWGAKLATAAETSRVVFGTMLHDMEQGKALLDQMQASKVAPFFDAKAIQDAGRDLLKAKVPVDQITGRMEQLGAIAIATKTPIEDLSRIYRQGMAKGAFQTDLVNQMAERGIDIYAALTAVTGKSGEALADAMQKGEIGAAQMNAAIDHMTLNHGIYAGVVENVAQTAAGMWAQSTSNIAMSLQTMFTGASSDSKSWLASFVDLTEQMKQRAAAVAPVVSQVVQTIGAFFYGLYSVAATVWAAIFGTANATFGGMLNTVMEWVTKFRWFFTNLVPLVQFVGLQIALAMIVAFNDISYWITDKLPAYLTWFADNWRAVFRDLAVGTATVFVNLTTNIKNAMMEIWAFIKSGGTQGLEFTWTPLLEGFKATVAELPNIPERPMTALEQGMQQQIQTIGTDLADSFDKMMNDAKASMEAAAVVPPVVPLQDTPAGGEQKPAESPGMSATEKAKAAENKAVLARSEEGQKLLAEFIRRGVKDDKKTVEQVAKESRDHLARISRNTENAPKMLARNWAG